MREDIRRILTRLKAATTRVFEKRYLGVNTGVEVRPEQLGGRGLYRASSWLVLRELFRSIPVGEGDVFVDIGSGMGRAVFMAARHPFKRVIGVERSPRLNQAAQEMLDRNRDKLACQDVELVSVDALEWEVPDDLTVVYLYCPFPDRVFESLVDKLIASIDRSPRPMQLIYFFSTTQDRDVLMATGRAERISFKVPWYVRSRFDEVWMFRLRPTGENV